MPFRCNFADGPWAGQSLTLDQKIPKFEVSRPSNRKVIGSIDTMFRYEPGISRLVNGVEEADFTITYDGPLHVLPGGNNAES